MIKKRGTLNTLVTGLLILALANSCDKDEACPSIVPVSQLSTTSGSSYIGCEAGPFYIALSDLDSCVTSAGFDSLMSSSWEPGCMMESLMTDSVSSDIVVTYLSSGVLDIQGVSQSVDVMPFDLIIQGQSVDLSEYPYYGALRFESDGPTYSFVMLNRYIGGCFHDELIWEITE